MAGKQAGSGCIIAFGLLFAAVGCVPGVFALNALRTARAMRSWVETPATILQVELKQGDDTAGVECSYRYQAPDPAVLEAGGRLTVFTGHRVGVHRGSDNVGSWQMDTYARLDAAVRHGRPVPCWYDPTDPAEAVLDRSERWGLIGFMAIFPLIFGLVGGGLAWFGWRQRRRSCEVAAAPPDLARQTMIPANLGSGLMAWIIALVWNAISWAAMLGILSHSGVPWPVFLVISLFPLIGLILLVSAVRSALRSLAHGRPRLRLDAGSWTTGSRVRATVLTRTRPLPGDAILARLAVVRRVTSAGEDSVTSTQTVWSLDLAVDAQAGRSEGDVWAHSLELQLPSDIEATSDDIAWHLEWQVVRPGPDLSATFILPVIAGGGDPAAPTGSELSLAADRAAPLAVLRRAGLRVSEDAGDVVIEAPALRNPVLYLGGLVASAIFSAGTVALWQWIGWWTTLLTVPLLLLCWRGTLRSAFWRSTITLGQGRIQVAAGWWLLTSHRLEAASVTAVERSSNMTSGEVAWFNMWLKTTAGERIAIIRALPGPAALRLATMIDLALKRQAR